MPVVLRSRIQTHVEPGDTESCRTEPQRRVGKPIIQAVRHFSPELMSLFRCSESQEAGEVRVTRRVADGTRSDQQCIFSQTRECNASARFSEVFLKWTRICFAPGQGWTFDEDALKRLGHCRFREWWRFKTIRVKWNCGELCYPLCHKALVIAPVRYDFGHGHARSAAKRHHFEDALREEMRFKAPHSSIDSPRRRDTAIVQAG
jgi:hypothetical protein